MALLLGTRLDLCAAAAGEQDEHALLHPNSCPGATTQPAWPHPKPAAEAGEQKALWEGISLQTGVESGVELLGVAQWQRQLPQCHTQPPQQHPGTQVSLTKATVSIVHQEVSAQGPGRVVIHAAGAVGHITHHHRLCIRESVGRHSSTEGHGCVTTAWVLPPSPLACHYGGTPRCHRATRRRGQALATLRDVNMIKLESGNPPLQLGKAVCNSADYPLIKQYAARFLMLQQGEQQRETRHSVVPRFHQPPLGTAATRTGRTAVLASLVVPAEPPSPHAWALCKAVNPICTWLCHSWMPVWPSLVTSRRAGA